MKLPRSVFLATALLGVAAPQLSASAAAPGAAAEAPDTEPGVITGRIYNPITREYVRNAQVQIEGAAANTVSENDGSYRLTGVPAGEVVVVVSYIGYEPVRAPLRLPPGAGATRDIELANPLTARAARDEPLVLQAFVVTSEREGNAKAIMSQRGSMNITNSVASDVFGDIAEGNVGEFLKHMAGVDLDTTEGDVRTVRLRGLSAEYTAVTLDGVSLASADANTGSSANSRAFSFEQVSLNSMDSIEVSKTVSADVDANAPAGTVNLKSKRAFDRQGRRISWQAHLNAHSTDLTLSRTNGPDNARRRKLLPGGIFEYSDLFLNRKLGVVLNISESNVYAVSARSTMTYNYTTTGTDTRPVVPATMADTIGPRITERFTTTLTADYKATPRLNFGLTLIYNYNDLWFDMRTATFTTGTRATVSGADPLYAFAATGTGARLAIVGQGVSKAGETWTYVPKFEYRKGDFLLEGRFVYSDSRSWYDPLGRRGEIFSTGSLTSAATTFKAERTAYKRADWTFTQLTGPSWSDGASYTTPALQIKDGRASRAKIGSGEIVGSLPLGKSPVVRLKAGLKTQREIRDYRNEREASYYTYTGPGAGTGAWRNYRLPYDLDLGLIETTALSVAGAPIYLPDVKQLAGLFNDHPEYFTRTMTAQNYYNAYVANRKHYVEDIDAAFLMATTTVRKLQLRAGLRWEGTGSNSREADPRTPAELAAAGYAESAGLATTIPGVEYQYFSKPQVHRKGSYDNFFPSGALKYRFLRELDLQLGYSRTIRRPSFNDISGIWVINDDALTVTAPNPKLKPEMSDNLSARLAYYLKPVGSLAVSVYQNTVKDLHLTSHLTAAEYGYSGPQDLGAYTFITTMPGSDETKIRGLEVEYSQSLSFLPQPLSGLNARAAYTRNQAEVTNSGMAPHTVSAGLNYTHRRLNVYTSINWTDDTPLNTAGTNYRRHRTGTDFGGSLKLPRGLSLFFAARNIFNAPYINLQEREGCPPVAINYGRFGTAWTFGVKGTF